MKSITAAFVLVALVALTAVAGELPKGTIEVSTTGSFSHQSFSADGNDAGSQTTMNLTGDFGYSLTNNLALSGGLLFQHDSNNPMTVDGGSSFGPQAGIRYNFTTNSNIVPFAEAKLGVLAYSGTYVIPGTETEMNPETTLWLPSVGGGMRFLLGETASVNVSGNFVHQTNAAGIQDLSSNDFRFGVGISVFPGGLASR